MLTETANLKSHLRCSTWIGKKIISLSKSLFGCWAIFSQTSVPSLITRPKLILSAELLGCYLLVLALLNLFYVVQ